MSGLGRELKDIESYWSKSNFFPSSREDFDIFACSIRKYIGGDMKTEPSMDSVDYAPLDLRSDLKRNEDLEEKIGTDFGMSREEKDILSNIKEEEEDGEFGEWQIEPMKREADVSDKEVIGLRREEKPERDKQREIDRMNQISPTVRELDNRGKLCYVKQEAEDLSLPVTSCLLKKDKDLNCQQLEMADILAPVFPSSHSIGFNEDQGASSQWEQNEVPTVKEEKPLRQRGKVITWKSKMTDSLQSTEKQLLASSETDTSAEPSIGSPDMSPTKQDAGDSIDVCQVFPCPECPFFHMEEEKLQQHIEKVHPEEFCRILTAKENGAENPPSPSSSHQHPALPKTPPIQTQADAGATESFPCPQLGENAE
ncbi:hypothetical protein AGOR_G00055430 [Albula goreensis]|uniref:Uncharacterized protein n=1 Tax=Albula goreensis TaxID=1534307 RepID=A0A8T3DVK5_9TELE|nr:hypothetical protein AGOR_G00055430 [Albula goreensis]